MNHSLESEAVVRSCYVKNVFLKISQNSQENPFVRASFLINLQAKVFSCESCKICNNIFFYRTPPVAASNNGFGWFF